MVTLKQIKKQVTRLDGNLEDDSEAFKAQVVLLSSLQVGPNIQRLQKFTGYPQDLITKFSRNLRKSGVWAGPRVYADWFDKDGGVAFVMDSMVAVGLLERSPQ